jgi:hypothetical protein
MYDNTYDPYTYNTTTSSADAAGIMLVTLGIVAVVAIVSYVVYALFLGMIFKKAGIASWKAWVPVYNTWLLLEMGDQPGWWSILAFIPFVNIVAAVFMYIAMYHVGLKFGKEGVFVLLAIFLPIVWLIWLAVDKTAVWSPLAGNGQVSGGDQAPPAAPSRPAAM